MTETRTPEEIAREPAMDCVAKILDEVLPEEVLPLLTKTETHLLFLKIQEAIIIAIRSERDQKPEPSKSFEEWFSNLFLWKYGKEPEIMNCRPSDFYHCWQACATSERARVRGALPDAKTRQRMVEWSLKSLTTKHVVKVGGDLNNPGVSDPDYKLAKESLEYGIEVCCDWIEKAFMMVSIGNLIATASQENQMALDEYWKKVMDSGFDHPCKQTCSGWQQGYDRGVAAERARVIKALPAREQYYKFIEDTLHNQTGESMGKLSYDWICDRINLVCEEKGGET